MSIMQVLLAVIQPKNYSLQAGSRIWVSPYSLFRFDVHFIASEPADDWSNKGTFASLQLLDLYM